MRSRRREDRAETRSLLGTLAALVLLLLMGAVAVQVWLAVTIGAGLLRLAEILTQNGS